MFAENLVRLGFFQSVSDIKPVPTHEKILAVGKSGPNATLNLFLLGLGWPWVGEFVGVILFMFSNPNYVGESQNTPFFRGLGLVILRSM